MANVCFKIYSDVTMSQALIFLQDLKLGHYMKIPPRIMFMTQVKTLLLLIQVKTLPVVDSVHYYYIAVMQVSVKLY